MVVTESILVKVKAISELKAFANATQALQRLRRVGVVPTSKGFQDLSGKFIKSEVAMKKATSVMGQFKFELLGILFFGMAVNRFLTGLLKPAFEVTGVFEILRDTLAILFLPTGEKVSNLLLDISDTLGGLSPTTQEFIGDLVLLLSVLFLGLFIFATFGLGLASIQMAFGLTAVAAAGLFGWILLIGAIVIGVILLFKNWEKITTELKVAMGVSALAIGGLLLAINPVLGAVVILIAVLILLKTAFDSLKASYDAGFFNPFIEAINKLIEAWNSLPVGLRLLLAGPAGLFNIPTIPLGGETEEDARFRTRAPFSTFLTEPPVASADITSNVNVDIGGILDTEGLLNQIMPEIQRQMNESAAQITQQLDRARTSTGG